MKTAKRTVLFRSHQELGARFTIFAGFEMPLSYRGIVEEHFAVRRAAGLFDLCHMGEFEVAGPRALELLERALTNSASELRPGRAQYSVMCADDGGTIDDLIVYRIGPERYLLCVNASNAEADYAWLRELNRGRAQLEDRSEETALIGVQGPRAPGILSALADFPLGRVARFGVSAGHLAGVRCLAARTGYTGEDGFELFVDRSQAARLFEAILQAGESDGLEPCGLGARDTLRLEAGLPLYGHELDRATSPLEAGLGAFVKFGRDFVGESALRSQLEGGLERRLVGVRTNDARSVARQGYKLYREGHEVGIITSGTFAPSFSRPLAMAYLADRELSAGCKAGADQVEVAIRKRQVPASLAGLPFYRRHRHHLQQE